MQRFKQTPTDERFDVNHCVSRPRVEILTFVLWQRCRPASTLHKVSRLFKREENDSGYDHCGSSALLVTLAWLNSLPVQLRQMGKGCENLSPCCCKY